MQQTQNYKLNLIETDDPISPTPINENTQVFDRVMAQVAGEQHLFKLGKVELTEANGPISLDLSGADLTKYDALFMLLYRKNDSGTYNTIGLWCAPSPEKMEKLFQKHLAAQRKKTA